MGLRDMRMIARLWLEIHIGDVMGARIVSTLLHIRAAAASEPMDGLDETVGSEQLKKHTCHMVVSHAYINARKW